MLWLSSNGTGRVTSRLQKFVSVQTDNVQVLLWDVAAFTIAVEITVLRQRHQVHSC